MSFNKIKSNKITNSISRRRIRQFVQNKRAYYSSIIFAILLISTSFIQYIANEKPIIVIYDHHIYFPIINDYPETTFGGTLESFTDYKNPKVLQLIQKKGWILFSLIPFSPNTINFYLDTPVPTPPSHTNWLGTDDQGRDILTRLLYGIRTSLFFGILLTVFSSLIGILIGATQGYFGGKIDLFGQRLTEIWTGLPVLYLLIIVSSLIVPNFFSLLIIMILFNWMILASVVRTEFFKTRSFEYVKAAETLGLSSFTIMMKHVLPNALVAIITYLPFMLTISISTLTALDFLGFGLPTGEPSLGELITQAKNNPYAYWIGITAFTSIGAILTLLTFIGEGIRDAFDPRLILK